MKTLMLFQEIPPNELSPKFLLVDGDYSRFNGIYINGATNNAKTQALQDELTKFIYGEDGKQITNFTRVPAKKWDRFIHCGFFM